MPRKHLQLVLDLSKAGTLKSLVYKDNVSECQRKDAGLTVAVIKIITGHRDHVQVDI
jgi:hypothetical protein